MEVWSLALEDEIPQNYENRSFPCLLFSDVEQRDGEVRTQIKRSKGDKCDVLTGCSRCLRMILFIICEEAVYTFASLKK